MAGAPAKFEVLLTEGVEQDLESIHDYISEVDCVANANYVLDELMEAVESLSRFPSAVATRRNWSASASKSTARPSSSRTA
jgi:plasmid stabilization system protein ParE